MNKVGTPRRGVRVLFSFIPWHLLVPDPDRLRIIFACIGAAIFYGIIHDQITIRLCPEYFTAFHPFLIATQSLTLLALAWAVVATWWMGLIIGIFVSAAARWGAWPKLSLSDIKNHIAVFIFILGGLALMAGVIGYFGYRAHLFSAPDIPADTLDPDRYPRFVAAWFMHLTSYFAGGLGALILCTMILVKRRALAPRASVRTPCAPTTEPRA